VTEQPPDVVHPGQLHDNSPEVLGALQRSTARDVGHLLDMWRNDLKPQLAEIKAELREVREDHHRATTRLEARVEKLEQAFTAVGVNLHDTKTSLEERVAVLEKAFAALSKPKRRKRRPGRK
jgi:chromosome segregation ATPase